MKKRGVRVIDLEDFMCRCGSIDFDVEYEEDRPVLMSCQKCSRKYEVKKIEKRTSIHNLPMSFGFRSLYWDRIEHNGKSISGIIEQGYDIREIFKSPK
ncbi:hypothetical protein ES703_111325 [subsurface metagenome]